MELAMQQKTMTAKAKVALAVLALVAMAAGGTWTTHAQSGGQILTKRQARHLVTPMIPDLAKKLNLSGTVRVEITIGPDGVVRKARVVGGHPVLAQEAQRAAEKSTFEPGPVETTEVIEFKF
jgi:TonB family protein